jgi:predicted MFS family arabinose efflux permease
MAVAGLGAFAFGVLGGVLSLKKKNEALVIFAVCTLLVVNVVVLKYAFDTYALTVPWLFILAATAVSIVSGVLITNSDEQFSKQTTHDSPV